jgi:hypothetical protein
VQRFRDAAQRRDRRHVLGLSGGETFGYFISMLLKRKFGFDSQPVIDAQIGILLLWIVIFLTISASIPLGLFVGTGTVLLTNFFELTDLSLSPKTGRAFKLISGIWIVLFNLYFLTLIRLEFGKPFDSKKILKPFCIRPAITVGIYFAVLIAVGFLAR